MGCDIHVRAERQTTAGWVPLDLGPGKYGDESDPPSEREYFIDRSYSLFALLGMTHRRPEVGPVVADLRDFPKDAHAETRARFESWTVDAHSPGWITFGEICEHALHPEIADLLVQLHASQVSFEKTDRLVFWFDN